MPPMKNVDKMSPDELRAELVSLLADGVLRYLAKRKVDRGQRNLQVSADSAECRLELSAQPGLSVTKPVNACSGHFSQ
jgi:hypothetical protein